MDELLKRTVVGLDLSLTGTGIALSDGTVRTVSSKPSGDAPIDETRRLMSAADAVMAFVPDSAELVAIEGLAFAANRSHHSAVVGMHHMVRERLARKGIPFCLVAPTSLKKFISKDGKCPKELIIMEVFERWGVKCRDNNQSDAFGLMKIARMVAMMDIPSNEYERELISKMSAQI